MLNKVWLPRSLEQFDILVDRVVKKYNIEDRHHAAAIISVAIRQLPNTQATTTLKFLGESVLKNLANYIANTKGDMLKHEGQVTQLADLIRQEPNNQEAWDGLRKAANDGSPLAKDQLAKLEANFSEPMPADQLRDVTSNVVELKT